MRNKTFVGDNFLAFRTSHAISCRIYDERTIRPNARQKISHSRILCRNESSIYVNPYDNNDSDIDIITIISVMFKHFILTSGVVVCYTLTAEQIKSVPHWRNERYCLHVLWQLQCRCTCAYYVTMFSTRKWDSLHRRHLQIDKKQSNKNVYFRNLSAHFTFRLDVDHTPKSMLEYSDPQSHLLGVEVQRRSASTEIWNDTSVEGGKKKLCRKKYSFLCSFVNYPGYRAGNGQGVDRMRASFALHI